PGETYEQGLARYQRASSASINAARVKPTVSGSSKRWNTYEQLEQQAANTTQSSSAVFSSDVAIMQGFSDQKNFVPIEHAPKTQQQQQQSILNNTNNGGNNTNTVNNGTDPFYQQMVYLVDKANRMPSNSIQLIYKILQNIVK